MTTTWRIALTCTLLAGALAASSVLAGCDNEVPTPPWLPNYTASGYGAGGKGGGGGGGGAKAGAAGEAGEAGASSTGGSSGEGGDGQ